MRAALLTFAALSLATTTAHAQCLTDTERTQFELEVRQLLGTSDLTNAELHHHVFSRLGFGHNPRRGDAYDRRATAQRRALAETIATRLYQSRSPRNGVGQNLAGLEDATREAPFSRFVYRLADQSIDEAYSEVRNASLELSRLRALLDAETDPTERARLQAELRLAQRVRSRINGDARNAAAAYRVALMTSATNVAVGDQIHEFWRNHFNIDATKTTWASIDYDKTLKRHQCGTFYELLTASAKHPAMLMYLDNFRSRRGRINENYGRELLELHTLGDDTLQFYSQQDVIDAANALTGWGIQFTEVAPGQHTARFAFYRGGHVPEALTMFDDSPRGVPLTLPAMNNGQGAPLEDAVQRGEALLEYLANHASTKQNICKKLSTWLLGHRSGGVVRGCVDAWGTDGDLAAIYRYFLTHPDLYRSEGWTKNTFLLKHKNAQELAVGAFRAAGLPVFDLGNLQRLVATSAQLGIPPARYPPPTGYSDERTHLSPGVLIRFGAFVHEQVDTSRLRLEVDGVALQGDALEQWVRDRIVNARAGADAETRHQRLLALSDRLVRDVYNQFGLPGRKARALHFALNRPDVRDSDGTTQDPLHTHFHLLLGHSSALRK